MSYVYYVSYGYSDGRTVGIGATEIGMPKELELKSIKDFQRLGSFIKSRNGNIPRMSDVVVHGVHLLRTE